LAFSPQEWTPFTGGVKAGEFDLDLTARRSADVPVVPARGWPVSKLPGGRQNTGEL
jgi:hypothetical protein